MIPKVPKSYHISPVVQAEIDALCMDLDLVLVQKTFAPIIPDSRHVFGSSLSPYDSLSFLCEDVERLVRQYCSLIPVKPVVTTSEFHKKYGKYVRIFDNFDSQLSFDWM